MIIYFIVTGDILASFASELIGTQENESIFTSRAFYVLIIGLILSPFIFKSAVHQLKIVSYLLFFSILFFILIFAIEMGTYGLYANDDKNYY